MNTKKDDLPADIEAADTLAAECWSAEQARIGAWHRLQRLTLIKLGLWPDEMILRPGEY